MADTQAGRSNLGIEAGGEMTDAGLIKAIAEQNPTALHTFYKRYASTVYAFAMRRVNAADVADEITNDTFIQVWRNAKDFEQRSSVKTWLLSIAKYKAMDALRVQYRSAAIEQEIPDDYHQHPDSAPGPFAQVLAKQTGQHLANCFDALSPDHRECLHLSFVEGMTLSEIATVVDAPANTVGTRIHHAKRKLKACMETCLGVGELV